MSDSSAASRKNAEIFGDQISEAFGAAGRAVDALNGTPPPPPPKDDGIDITVRIER